MAGPWERYQTQAPAASGASGPWERYAAPQKEKAGLIGSFLEGAQTLGLGDEAQAYAANPTEENRRAFLKAGESKFRQVGFGEGDNWEALKQLVGGSAGQLVAPIAAGLAATPFTTPVGGLAAASAVSGSQYTIQNLLRQAQEQEAAAAKGEKPQAVSIGRALTAATGQTALDLVGGKVFAPLAKAFPFMRPLLNKAGGKATERAGQVLADAAEKGTIQFVGGVAKGVGKGVAFEMPQEVAQQALERWQAGLSLLDEEARDEYGQAMIGALVLGGGLGGISGAVKARGAAQEEADLADKAAAEKEAAAAEAEAVPTGEPAGERPDVFAFEKSVKSRLAEAAGRDLSDRGSSAINNLAKIVSNDISLGTPESIARSEKYISDWEDTFAAGVDYEADVAEPLMRPALNPDGTPAVDAEGKPVYEGALVEAKRMVEEARANLPPVEEAAPEGLTPQAYVDRYMAGEGRGDTPADLEMQQYAANNAADIEAEFARRTQGEAARGPSGEPTAPVDAGVGAGVPTDRGPAPAGAAAPESGGVEPRPVGVGEPAAPDVTVGADEESDTLTPAPKMGIASDFVVNIADKFAQAPLADAWAKKALGEAAVPTELQTAPILERVETIQAGQQRDLSRSKFNPIIEAAANLGVDIGDFNYFLWLDHAAERNREVAKKSEAFPEGGAGITTAQAQAGLQQIADEGLMPKYNLLKKKVQDLVRFNLEEDVKAGLLSQEQMDYLLKTYQNYVPLKGFAADNDILTADIDEDADAITARRDEAMKAMRAASPGGSVQEFRKAIGRGSMPLAPLFNLMQDSEQRIQRRALNRARIPLVRQWKKSPAAFDGIMNVYTDSNPKKVIVGRDRAGIKYGPVKGGMQQEYYRNRAKYMIVKDNGVTYYVEFAPTQSGQALQRMFSNMTPKEMEGAAKSVAKVNNFLKGMLTYKNPLHLIFVAPFRDFSSAIATAMHHQNLKGSPVYKKNLAGRTFLYAMPLSGTWGTIARYVFTNKPMNTKEGKQLQEMIREGGAALHTRFTDVQEKSKVAQQAIKRLQGIDNMSPKERATSVFSALNQWLDNLADVTDLSARFATYRAAMDYGIEPADAARLALDSSLNLTRRGEKARGIDLIFPFFATGVEATRKTGRMLKNGRGAVKILGALMAYGVLESMINAAMSGDDDNDGQENYLDQNATMRIGRAILYYGPGENDYVKVPIDPMLGYFKFVGNRIGDLMLGNASTGDVTSDLFFGAASVASPVRVPQADAPSALVAITPLVGKPFAEAVANKNFFGGPIYQPSQFDAAPASELGRATTGEGWKWLARTMNNITGGSEAVKGKVDFQPEIYRHIIEGWLGGPYQLGKQVAGLPAAEGAADIPGVRSFVGTGGEYSAQTKFFENSSNIRQIMNRLTKLTPEQQEAQGAEFFLDTDPRIIDAYQIVDKQLDKINKEQRGVLKYIRENPGEYSKEDEKAVLDYYLAEKTELYSAFNYVYNGVKKEQ